MRSATKNARCCKGFMVNLKTIAAEATIAGALAFTALGFGAGMANADPPSHDVAATAWKLDDFEWDDWEGPGWGPGWRGGPGWGWGWGGCAWIPPAVAWWVPPAVCGGG
jgi:hypothetical protein